ncbi:zincin-like metallopeptidase domain-containing protein [Acuticoccus sp. MNP-M23]|uniref:ArdC family protein n=1 Tax=Acuticoccus sp. MNP-M23 TaxID=3072793 RepID=UPI00281610C4|nr:zincin-like metallopeptidase domain-containing protein [Acuticoccus sp. MNP-M23]WMS43103.1 zincin-like metallopeptidase domain-containing protein [Acuticoccus sp. MNP-M23]
MTTDVYEKITTQIITELEKGVRPWHQPWAAGHLAGPVSRPVRSNGEPYSGINILGLWVTAMQKGYGAPIWMTFNQAKVLGASVRKGEKGALVVYAGAITRSETNEKGEDQERDIPFLKGYTVFNVEQIDGLPAHYTASHPVRLNEDERIAAAEAFFAATGAVLAHGGSGAHYTPALDRIQMPDFAAFRNAGAYYATLAHETTHWTGHKSRLDRNLGGSRFGSQAYAMEELVAELGAAFLCADLGLEPQIEEDHAPYISNWLEDLKSDKRAIFTAASQAQKAADFLHGLLPRTNEDPAEPLCEAAA